MNNHCYSFWLTFAVVSNPICHISFRILVFGLFFHYFNHVKLQDIEKERRKSENPEAMDEDVDEDVAEIKAAHFEESMKYARRSVSDADIRKYQAFAQTLQQSRGFGSEFRFSDSRAGASDPFATSAGAAEEDDLYS